jgi:hypothetical protein
MKEEVLNCSENIKDVLIQLAVEDNLPLDMTQLDASLFIPCIVPLVDKLNALQDKINLIQKIIL